MTRFECDVFEIYKLHFILVLSTYVELYNVKFVRYLSLVVLFAQV